jgi:S-adenosylmethionine hydrolase
MHQVTAPLITLLSDFGLKDPYVAEMKAVISTISPATRIIDITHSVEKFNIRMGAFLLASASRYFPKGTVHVAVVDPGVGTKRQAILIETNNAYYIGPDNGILMIAAQSEGIKHVYKITNEKLMLQKVSFTFHGRDLFAPAAAHLANGVEPHKFGPTLNKYETPRFTRASLKADKLCGEVVHIDDFGNVITNITKENLDKIGVEPKEMLYIKLNSTVMNLTFCTVYSDVPTNCPSALIGSHDFLEIAANQGNAARKLRAQVGHIITVSRRH